jgi:hypothetical protein
MKILILREYSLDVVQYFQHFDVSKKHHDLLLNQRNHVVSLLLGILFRYCWNGTKSGDSWSFGIHRPVKVGKRKRREKGKVNGRESIYDRIR